MDNENLTPQYRIEEYLEAIVEGWAEATQYPYPDYPSWRIEEFLDAFITYIWEDGDHPRHPCPEPAWRLEECLRAIYDVMTGAATPWAFPTPTNNIEEYLAAIHAYLADGTELPVPEPVWRIEQWLAYVLDAVKQGGGVETTVSGTMVHITNALAKAALSVLASIEPIQSLHGYSSPWPAGGGKNKLGNTATTATVQGVTYTVNSDGTIGVDGKSTGWTGLTIGTVTLPAGDYILSAGVPHTNFYNLFLEMSGDTTGSTSSGDKSFTLTGESTITVKLYARPGFQQPTGSIVYPMIRLATVTDGAFAPYSNICPISGRTGLSVWDDPKYGGTVAWNQLVPKTTASTTINGITITNNGDGSWTLNGTATAHLTYNITPSLASRLSGHKALLTADNGVVGEWGFVANGGYAEPSKINRITNFAFNGVLKVGNE